MTDAIRQFLHDELPHVESFDDDDDLLAPGMLDSLAIIRLVAALEDAEGISVGQAEIEPDNLRSLTAIAAFVTRKKQGA